MRDYLQDLLSGAPTSADFFRASFLKQSERISTVNAASGKFVIPAVLAELKKQNHAVSEAVDRNLSALEKGGAALTITGQQLGVFGGPLFTLYKIASTISLAGTLEKESGIRVVPLFWMQSEDHDFAEVKTTTFFYSGEELRDVSLEIPSNELGDSTGRLQINASRAGELMAFLDEWTGADPEFKGALQQSFGRPGTFSGAMARLIQQVFGPYGLLVFDPDRRAVKEAYKDFIASSFLRARSIGRVLSDRCEKLRLAGYPLQAVVKPQSPLFFVSQDGRRERLTESSDGIWAGERVEFNKNSLYELLDREPERFTASALMRPVFQDTIFPTCAYVAGPSEFKYLVQATPLYQFFNCLQPLVVPRAHFVVVEERSRRLMEKLGITPEDAGRTPEDVILRNEKNPQFDAERIFSPLSTEILSRLSALQPELESVDVNLKRALRLTHESVKTNISRLRSKFEHAVLRREEASVQQFLRVKNSLYPREHSQERVICFSQYLLRYGRGFLDKVFAEIDPLEGWKIRPLYPEQAA